MKKHIILTVIFSFLILFTLSSAVFGAGAIPVVTITGDSEVGTVGIVTVSAIDSETNAGIQYIRLYEDGTLVDSKVCSESKTCIFTKVFVEVQETQHTYYAVVADKSMNIVESEDININFRGTEEGMDTVPMVTLTADPNPTETTSIIIVSAVDALSNAGIQYIRLYEDGQWIESKFCNEEKACVLATARVETQETQHTYYAVVADKSMNIVESEEETVEFEGLNIPDPEAVPVVTITADPEEAETTSVITISAVDSGNNAGIQYIRLYEDGQWIESKFCGESSTCTFSYLTTEMEETQHTYYAVVADKSMNIVESEDVTVRFSGDESQDPHPSVTITADPEEAETTSVITISAVDSGNNAGIQNIRLYEDGQWIESKFCNEETSCNFATTIVENEATTHTYYGEIIDKGMNIVQSEEVEVTFSGELEIPGPEEPGMPETNTPPILTIPDFETVVGVPIPAINLHSFTFDREQEDHELDFTILTQTNPDLMHCLVIGNEEIVCDIPMETGSTSVLVEASDGWMTGSDWFTIIVNENGIEIPEAPEPPAPEIPPFTVVPGGPYSCNPGDTITIEASAYSGQPPYTFDWDLDINGFYETQGSSVSYNCGVPGTYSVPVRGTDWDWTRDTDVVTVNVVGSSLVADANGDYTCAIGGTVNLDGSATGGIPGYNYSWDLDMDTVFETAQEDPVFNCAVIGTYQVTLQVTDSFGTIDTDTALVTVTPPVLTVDAQGPYSCDPGETIVLTGVASSGIPPYNYSWDLDSDGLYESAGQFANYLCGAVPGTYNVSVEATDAVSATAADTAQIFVGLNNDPVITSTPVEEAGTEVLYEYDVEAFDPDGDPITYSLVTSPSGMTIASANGLIEWTPEESQLGSHNVVVAVEDNRGGFATQSFIIEVTEGEITGEGNSDDLVMTRLSLFNEDYLNGGDVLDMSITFENRGHSKFENLRTTVMIPDLGQREREGPYDLKAGDEKSSRFTLEIPEGTEPGYYDIMVVITNTEEARRVIFREFRVN